VYLGTMLTASQVEILWHSDIGARLESLIYLWKTMP
jgi:hypothetical protein